jgi:hypothetical protein
VAFCVPTYVTAFHVRALQLHKQQKIMQLIARDGLALRPSQQLLRGDPLGTKVDVAIQGMLVEGCNKGYAFAPLPTRVTLVLPPGLQYGGRLFPGALRNGDAPRLALEHSDSLRVLAVELEKRRPEGLDAWMPIRVGQLCVHVMA